MRAVGAVPKSLAASLSLPATTAIPAAQVLAWQEMEGTADRTSGPWLEGLSEREAPESPACVYLFVSRSQGNLRTPPFYSLKTFPPPEELGSHNDPQGQSRTQTQDYFC